MPNSNRRICSGLFVIPMRRAFIKQHDPDRQERYNAMIACMKKCLEKKKEKVD